jgi:hypothetical protein
LSNPIGLLPVEYLRRLKEGGIDPSAVAAASQTGPYGEVILSVNKLIVFCLALAFITITPKIQAQQSKGLTPAPVPIQIGAAKKVFVSNGGGESFETVMDQTVFNGGPDRPYNEFYAGLNDWGRYNLVSSPSDADLVLEISWALSDTGLRLPLLGQLRLQIIDPRTHTALWSLIEYVRGAVLLGNRDKNFEQAMSTIMTPLKQVAAPPLGSPTHD